MLTTIDKHTVVDSRPRYRFGHLPLDGTDTGPVQTGPYTRRFSFVRVLRAAYSMKPFNAFVLVADNLTFRFFGGSTHFVRSFDFVLALMIITYLSANCRRRWMSRLMNRCLGSFFHSLPHIVIFIANNLDVYYHGFAYGIESDTDALQDVVQCGRTLDLPLLSSTQDATLWARP